MNRPRRATNCRARDVMILTIWLGCGLVIPSPSFADILVPTVPIDYRVGPIPVPYSGDYTAYPYTLGSIPDINDSSLATFTHVQGLDNVLQSNGTRVDTGTFYLLRYQIDPKAVSFRIEFTARTDDTPLEAFNQFLILGLSPDGVTPGHTLTQTTAREPTTFGVEFSRTGNTGNLPGSEDWGLNSMINPDGTLRLVLQGGYGAGPNQPGTMNSYLYDVNASFTTVPEPCTAGLLGLGGLFMIAFLYFRKGRSLVA